MDSYEAIVKTTFYETFVSKNIHHSTDNVSQKESIQRKYLTDTPFKRIE
jgi:hypothetical protein